MAQNVELINWDDAMQQVGDDEEFLRELLGDLRTELETQLNSISGIIQVRTFASFHSLSHNFSLYRILRILHTNE